MKIVRLVAVEVFSCFVELRCRQGSTRSTVGRPEDAEGSAQL